MRTKHSPPYYRLACRRILKTNPPIPEGLSPEVADLIAKLLVKEPRKRLGGGEQDALELKKHPFFRGLDWAALAEKRVPAPFVPRIAGELDVSNFSEEFTRMTPTDSPAVIPPNFDKIFKVSARRQHRGGLEAGGRQQT